MHLLQRALRSIRQQSLRAIEILVLDDGSYDKTPELLERISHQDSRVRWFRQDRSLGLACALNRLIENSQGRWLARMDDDDVSYPHRLALQLSWMREQKIDVCGTWYRRRSMLGKAIARPPVDDFQIRTELLFQPPLLHPSVMLSREVLERFGMYSQDYPHAEDYELWVRLAPHVKFGNVPKVLMDYSVSPRQVSRRHNPEQVESARRIRKRCLETFGIRHDDVQLKIHCHLRDPVPIKAMSILDEIEDWLITLGQQLPKETNRVVQKQWFLSCVRAAGLGLDVFRRFVASPLAQQMPCSSRLILKAMCMARLRYRSLLYRWLEPVATIG